VAENSSANADIAQLVEQVIRNDQVVGSNPTIGSSATGDAQRLFKSFLARNELVASAFA
jgi:hypothetical protein